MEDFEIILQQITGKNPEELTEADIEFLRARASYLSEEDRQKFAEVLGGGKVSGEEITEENKPKKRGRQRKNKNQ